MVLSFTENNSGIAVDIKSSLMHGKVQIPLPINSKPVVANLKKLSLTLDASDISGTSKNKPSNNEPANPRDIPSLSLTSNNTLLTEKI